MSCVRHWWNDPDSLRGHLVAILGFVILSGVYLGWRVGRWIRGLLPYDDEF